MPRTKQVVGGNGKADSLGSVSNAGAAAVEATAPYVASVTLQGTSPILFHAWNVESVDAKAKAAKNSAAKKTDDVESYVYRDEKGLICLPGKYVVGAIIEAARYRQDPRSPRKSARDLYRAGVVPFTVLATIGTASSKTVKTWDYLDKQRVTVQRNGITRIRPAFLEGWTASLDISVLIPEYIPPAVLLNVLSEAGRLVGVGDYRPTYGRFQVTRFEVNEA